MPQQEFEIDIPEQGFSKRLLIEEAQEFFDNEIAFYQRVSAAMNQNLQFGQWGLGQQTAALNSGRNLCNSIRESISSGSTDKLSEFIQRARSFQLVVGQGKLACTRFG